MDDTIIPARIRVPPSSGLSRSRPDSLVAACWAVPLSVVVAPAGSGKTTLLAMWARGESTAGRRVAWYQAGSSEASPARLLRYLEASLRQVQPSLASGWDSLGAAAAALEGIALPPLALVIDDAHTLISTPAEAALEQLVSYLPPDVHVILAGRHSPSFDLPRWRLAGNVVEVGSDDLRFRSWEVEELFVHQYGVRLRPEELAELARRTEGWAAGLALFHLATSTKSVSERRRVLASLSSRLRDTRDYLTRNVLADLAADQREFLVRTCVLGRLSAAWCDELLGTSGSARILQELERRQLFIVSEDSGTYHQHEVMRSFLEEILLEQIGEQATRDLYARAGPLLESGGAAPEALRAYCRAQDWPAANRLLQLSGDRVFDQLNPWVDPLPPAIADHDAWSLLAAARRQVQSGHWPAALANYRRAEEVSIGALVSRTCQRERFQLAAWVEPGMRPSAYWTGVLRAALARQPLGAVQPAPGSGRAGDHLACGLAALAAGHVRQADAILAGVSQDPADAPVLSRWTAVASALTSWLIDGTHRETGLRASLDALEPFVPPWLGRLLQSAAGGAGNVLAELEVGRCEAAATDNPWIDLALGLLKGGCLLAAGSRIDCEAHLDEVVAIALRLGVTVVAAWADAAASLVSLGRDPDYTIGRAVHADQLAASVACPGASALARLVEAAARANPGWQQVASGLERDGVIPLAGVVEHFLLSAPAGVRDTAGSSRVPSGHFPESVDSRDAAAVTVCCLGPFVMSVGDRPISPAATKPRVRALLYRLALQAGRPVHRDVLRAALWPDDDIRTGTRNLQVAISSLRQLLETQAGAGALVARRGAAYVLDHAGGFHDVSRLETAVAQGRSVTRDGGNTSVIPILKAAVGLYRGELLAEVGLVEWVLDDRERCRLLAAEASQLLAENLMRTGDLRAAAESAEAGLAIDRYCDGLWKVIITAHDLNADRAAHARARRGYSRVLDELGVGANDG